MSDARQLLSDVDSVLNKEMDETQLKTTVTNLESIQKIMTQLSGT